MSSNGFNAANLGRASRGLSNDEFRQATYRVIDYIIKYQDDVKDKQPTPDVEPGFLRPLLPSEAPERSEEWTEVLRDFDRVFMRGCTHWLSSNFRAFFPLGFSYPSFLGDMLSEGMTTVGFTWQSCPSSTELETVMMDWLAKAMDLPKQFHHDGKGPGGGCIQRTSSDAMLMTLLAARRKAMCAQLDKDPTRSEYELLAKMMAYTSECAHSCVERAGKVAMVQMRSLETDDQVSLRGNTLRRAIEEDVKAGMIPMFVCVPIGTTSCCSFDNLSEIGPICAEYGIWVHLEAAYAGCALLCPEFRHFAKGIEYATSFACNPHKITMVTFDCCALWVANTADMTNSLFVDPLYLQHSNQGSVIDYMHWEIPLGRWSRSLKFWFAFRMIGLEGLRAYIRRGVTEARHLEMLIGKNPKFEVVFPVRLGLVCVRMIGDNCTLKECNALNKKLHDAISMDKRLFLSPATVKGKMFLRVVTGGCTSSIESVEKCWDIIKEAASTLDHVRPADGLSKDHAR